MSCLLLLVFSSEQQVPIRLICTYVGPSTLWLDGYDKREMETNRSPPPACNLVSLAEQLHISAEKPTPSLRLRCFVSCSAVLSSRAVWRANAKLVRIFLASQSLSDTPYRFNKDTLRTSHSRTLGLKSGQYKPSPNPASRAPDLFGQSFFFGQKISGGREARHAGPGDVLIFRGRPEGGQAEGGALAVAHRSPDTVEGQRRLVLTIDVGDLTSSIGQGRA